MKTWILLFSAIVLSVNCSSAWEPVTVNETGAMMDDGLTRRTFHVFISGTHVFSSRTTFFGREFKFFIHFERPDEDMETLVIRDLCFSEFLPPCADEDTLSGRFEMARAFRADSVDLLRDWDSQPVWVSPVIHIPFSGYTTRFFFSSMSRLQGNVWDNLVTRINSEFHINDPIILRFVPIGESGFLIHNDLPSFSIAYTTDLSQETDFLDIGDPRIRYLEIAESQTFHGLVVRGVATRDPWTSQRVMFRFLTANGAEIAVKEIALPWTEDQTQMNVNVGLTTDFLSDNPMLTVYANGQETATCRVDTLKALYQP